MVAFGFNTASASAPNVSATFEELALPLFGSLYNFAHWLTQNREEAEDLVQETYAKALKGFGSFQPGTNFRAWIFRILRNTFLTSRTGLAMTRTMPLGITYRDWFEHVSRIEALDEVNFRQPSGNVQFRALQEGDPFLFKLHRDD